MQGTLASGAEKGASQIGGKGGSPRDTNPGRQQQQQQQRDSSAERNYQEYVRNVASGREINEGQRDRVLAAAGKTIRDFESDVRQAQGGCNAVAEQV